MPPADPTLTLTDARRIALAAQGFASPRPADVRAGDVAALIERLGLLQLDFVNVVCPSHYLVAFSRLGPYPRTLLHEVAYRSGRFTEQWAHEASLIPIETWPLLRDRMEIHRARPWGFDEIMRRHRAYVEKALEEIRVRGPLGPADLPDPDHTARRMPGTWYGSVPRAVLEAHFGRGRLAVVDRRPDFSRVFDLAERVIPPDQFTLRLDVADAHRRLILQAAAALGVATCGDLADYFRMPVSAVRPRLAELLRAGRLTAVTIEGWREPAYAAGTPVPGPPPAAAALLSPFDPVVWCRARTRRLFGFDYRFEIFIPQAKRRWGSYVLPFLLGDRLAARVDVKADRAARRLRVNGAWIEDGESPQPVSRALAAELASLAAWLDLGGVTFGRRGNLMRTLRAAG